MSIEVRFAPEVESDLGDAAAWYGQRREGLGHEFLWSVESTIDLVKRKPELHPIVYRSYRRAMVRRFPYVVFYEIAGQQLTIYGVIHTSMDPAKWRNRLP